MKLYFAAILDYNYLGRLKCLYESMIQHHNDFTLYIVCLDERLYSYLSENKLNYTTVIPLKDIEGFYPELKSVKNERTVIDYIFTLSPYYPSYILENYSEIPFICSLDVDQYFFGSCEGIFKELENCSILITPHRFPEKIKDFEAFGIYNVSFQIFKNDKYGKECLRIWREQCLAWCKDELEDNKFADQKYLELWDKYLGNKVKPIKDLGIGLAPWNIENYDIAVKDNVVYIDQHKLILFHYQGLRFLNNQLINSGFSNYRAKATPLFIRHVLAPITFHLSKTTTEKKRDNIARKTFDNKKGLLAQINNEGFYYLVKNRLISLDRVYYFNNRIKKFNGVLNRFKNVH